MPPLAFCIGSSSAHDSHLICFQDFTRFLPDSRNLVGIVENIFFLFFLNQERKYNFGENNFAHKINLKLTPMIIKTSKQQP
jgi:hypothetical protein